jgi:tetratricopeptide (TPR) repeat protein
MTSYKQLLVTLCFALISFPVFAQAEEAEKLIREKKYKEANQIIDKELAKKPNDASLNFLKWRARYNGGPDVKEYFKFLNRAIELNSSYSEAYCERGAFFMRMLRFEDAREDIDAAVKFANTDSTLKESLMMLAAYYQSTRNFDEAIKINLDILKKDSLDVPALNNLALGYQDVGQLDKALEVLYKIEKIDPKVVYSAVNIGFVLSKMDQYEKAIEYFDKAEKMSKNEPLIYSNRAYAKFKIKKYSDALSDINKSIKMFPSNSYAYRIRAQIYLETKNTDKACEDLNTSLGYKYTQIYGNEAKELRDKYCIK